MQLIIIGSFVIYKMKTVDDEVVDVVWTRPDGKLTGCSVRPTLKSVPLSCTKLCLSVYSGF